MFLQSSNPKFEIHYGSGSRSRTYIFGFKVRRAASCTIPEEVAQTSVCVVTNRGWSEFIEYSMKRLAVTRQTEGCATRLCNLVAEEGVEPSSLDYRSSALALSYTAKRVLVDPTGLKPAPHGLKGRCSVTRAPDQYDLRFKISNFRLRIAEIKAI